jgi:hypothetical protein
MWKHTFVIRYLGASKVFHNKSLLFSMGFYLGKCNQVKVYYLWKRYFQPQIISYLKQFLIRRKYRRVEAINAFKIVAMECLEGYVKVYFNYSHKPRTSKVLHNKSLQFNVTFYLDKSNLVFQSLSQVKIFHLIL